MEHMTEPESNGLSVRVPMTDMKDILRQIWKSRGTEPKMGELYEKYKPLVFEDLDK